MLLARSNPTGADSFEQVFCRLAIALRFQDVDAQTIAAYYDVLRDFHLSAVASAAEELKREPGRKYFPTTAEWHAVAKKHTLEQEREAVRGAARTPPCPVCGDTGFALHACPGDGTCGKSCRYPHGYTTQCSCRPTNQRFQALHRSV